MKQNVSIISGSRGSVLLNIIIIILIVGIIGAAMVSVMSTSSVQQVFSGYSTRAELLAESGYRYLAVRYKQATGGVDKNTTLANLDGETFTLNGDDGGFTLSVSPFFYTSRTDAGAGDTILPARIPGSMPQGFVLPATGTIGVRSGARYDVYSYTSYTGDSQQFDFENIADANDGSPGLKSSIATGYSIGIVLASQVKTLTQGSGNSLVVTGASTQMPSYDGVFEIINTSGEFKDASGTGTAIYAYRFRSGNTLSDIYPYGDPGGSFSVALDSTTRVVVHRSAEISVTGTLYPGSPLEINRAFKRMAALGETLVTVSADDLLYDSPDNLLKPLIGGADILGDSENSETGKIGGAMKFDGDWDYIRLNDDDSIDLGTHGSIGAWVKVTAFDNNFAGIVRKGGLSDDSDAAYSLEFRAGRRIRLKIFSSSSSLYLDSVSDLTAGIWYHVAGTWGPSGMNVYIDGHLDSSRPETLTVRNTSGTLQIAAQLDESFNPLQKNYALNGILDEVFVYDTEKSLCEIRDIYNNPCNTGCDALAWYPVSGNYDDESGEDKLGDDGLNGIGSGVVMVDNRFGCPDKAAEFELWDRVEIPSESTFDFTGVFSVSVWVKINSWSVFLGSDPFVSKGHDSFRVERYKKTNNANFGATGLSKTDTRGNKNLHDGNWHHIVAVYDGSRKYLYVDGVQDDFDNVSGTLDLNNDTVRFGSRNVFRVFNGCLDDIAIWDKALGPDEVNNVHRGTRTDPSKP